MSSCVLRSLRCVCRIHTCLHDSTDVHLQDADKYHQLFSSDKAPTLYHVIPVLEALCARWEKKLMDLKYSVFHPALQAGIDKLDKYYAKLDNTDVYILALHQLAILLAREAAADLTHIVLHPYYKLRYIEKKWGGKAEQDAKIAAGNPNAINWIEHAREVVDAAVSVSFHYVPSYTHTHS